MSAKYSAQFAEVRKLIKAKGLFTDAAVDSHSMEYYNHLGLNEFYFQTANPAAIADNLLAVIAARALHSASGADYFPEIRQVDEKTGDVFALARASLTNRKASQNYKVEQQFELEFLDMGLSSNKQQMRMQCYRSTGSVFGIDGDTERLRTYFFQKPKFPLKPEELSPNEKDLSKLLDVDFYASKKRTVTASIFEKLNSQVVDDSTGLALFVNVVPRGTGHRIDLAFRRGPHTEDFFSRLGDCVTMWGFYSQRKYVEPLANGATVITSFIETLPVKELVDPDMAEEDRIDHLLTALRMQFAMPKSKFADFARDRLLTVHEAAYAMSACQFALHFSGTVGHSFPRLEKLVKQFGGKNLTMQEVYELRTRLKTCPFSEEMIFKVVEDNPEIVKLLYKEFESLHNPRMKRGVFSEECELKEKILRLDSSEAVPVFLKFRLFNQHILRTNFWMNSKCGFAFRFSGAFLPASDFPVLPYSVFFQVASKSVGFHVRFADVARGGVRVVQSVGTVAYERNKRTVLDEVFKLAFTQQFKNKDISEGGSKGIILLNKAKTLPEAQLLTPMAFKAYVDNMLDLLLPHHDVVDLLGMSEVCFLGPDENTGTGGLVDWAALRAKERGAWFWKAFTTGKAPSKGGIPHDVFGMTTASVETYVRGIYEKLNLKEEEVTRIQTGGPDGDLGCNALLQTKSKTIAVVDGSGVVYDPRGLDAAELKRLAHLRFEGKPTSAMHYNPALLSPGGFQVDQEARDITLPDGTRVASGFEFRNTFHLSSYASADLFNPCGGRPASITPQNVDKLFDPKTGEKKFKYIVEGANVFITDDARRILEDRGVILFKDASTNKGGVTSSSMEVLAALALTEEEFNEHMQVRDMKNPPKFYREYVQAILKRIRENAKLEFEALWNEAKRTGMHRCDLTDILSQKIIELKQDIAKSNALWHDDALVNFVLQTAIPDILVPGLISVETFRQRVPEPYQKAIFTTFLASRFFYKQQFTADVSAFAFIAYLDEIKEQMVAGAAAAAAPAATPAVAVAARVAADASATAAAA
ncbi:glutamate dehydrogenase 2 [Cyclospora cayetanensis]|uniref:Glutamate dehydrogenase 2 n=1 Tax=Cyclospora cayetanensis TaxID=88456 RepID=A0A6P6S1X1_9EIME|nr:glutamate dehydrogenase 2 [Cyclospora cayetanensis]